MHDPQGSVYLHIYDKNNLKKNKPVPKQYCSVTGLTGPLMSGERRKPNNESGDTLLLTQHSRDREEGEGCGGGEEVKKQRTNRQECQLSLVEFTPTTVLFHIMAGPLLRASVSVNAQSPSVTKIWVVPC